MATKKRRIPVSLSSELEAILEDFAKKNEISLSQAILLFLEHGIETAEDKYFSELADELDAKTKKYISHEEFWDSVLPK